MVSTLEGEIKERLIATLELALAPDAIDDDAPLFGEGLGLDSIDAFELAAMLSLDFGVEIIDAERARTILATVRSIADFVRLDRAQ